MRLLFVFLTIFSLSVNSFASNELNLLSPAYFWHSPNSSVKIEFKDSQLTVSSTLASTGIYNRLPLRASTKDFDLLLIKMKTTRDGVGEVSWTSREGTFSFLKNYPFYLRRAGQFHVYYINLAAYNRDRSRIDHLLLFPFSGPGTAVIQEFRLTKGDLREKVLAGWQEFFGPGGRMPDGFNFLVIRSPRLFGKPFILYVNYFLLILLAAVILARSKSDFRRHFLLVLLACWILLELSSLLNNWISLRNDWRYFGKSLEEKRAMINTKDYYQFLKFADKMLPPGAGFAIYTPIIYDASRAIYYLYPRPLQSNPPYILVFYQKIGGDISKKYHFWKSFKEGIYILKSKSKEYGKTD